MHQLVYIVSILIFDVEFSTMQLALQPHPKQCIYFFEGDSNLELNFTKSDSSRTQILVTLLGYETVEKRREANRIYYEEGSPVETRFPYFYLQYESIEKPVSTFSISDLDCNWETTLEKARENHDFKNWVYFVQKKSQNIYLIWHALSFGLTSGNVIDE